MWKRLLLVTAVSAAMSSMAIAAPLTVGFSQVGSESGWRAAETSVAKEEAAKRGITLKIADGQQKQENQIKAVRSFIAQGVDAIFIAPVVATGWEPVLKEAKEAKIPVFLLDRSIDVKDKDLYMTTVTANTVLEGQLIGDWLVKTVDGKPCNGVKGKRSWRALSKLRITAKTSAWCSLITTIWPSAPSRPLKKLV